MTLSVMENHDTFKTALTDYQIALGDIPKILERYLDFVARTGKPLFSWDMISGLILKKFDNVCEGYSTEKSVPCVRISGEVASVDELKLECIKSINQLSGVPFTIQRMCEMLLSPRQNYSRLEKFLRGFIRVVKVVTTVDRVGKRITTESESFANAMSPFQMNEAGDNWAGFSNYSDESSSNARSSSPISDLNCGIEAKCDLDYDEKSIDESMPDTIAPFANNKQQQSLSQNLYASDGFFIEQKTISMPPIGALFKPIDQLEAFVQNVSREQVESTSESVTLSKKRVSEDSGITEEGAAKEVEDLVTKYTSPSKKARFDDDEEESLLEVNNGLVSSRSSELSACAVEASSSNDIAPGEELQNNAVEKSADKGCIECMDEGVNEASDGDTAMDCADKRTEECADEVESGQPSAVETSVISSQSEEGEGEYSVAECAQSSTVACSESLAMEVTDNTEEGPKDNEGECAESTVECSESSAVEGADDVLDKPIGGLEECAASGTMKLNAVECGALKLNAVECDALKLNAVECEALELSSLECDGQSNERCADVVNSEASTEVPDQSNYDDHVEKMGVIEDSD